MEEFEGEIRESEVEKPACKLFESRGWIRIKIALAQKKGWPDNFFGRRGRAIFVEFKRPGEEPTKQQRKRHKELREHGFSVFLIDNMLDADVVSR